MRHHPEPPRKVPADATRSPRRRLSTPSAVSGRKSDPVWPPARRRIEPQALVAAVVTLAILAGLGWMAASRGDPGAAGGAIVRTEFPSVRDSAEALAAPAAEDSADPDAQAAELAAPDPQAPLPGGVMPDYGDPVLSAVPDALPVGEAPTAANAARKASPVLIFDSGAKRNAGGGASTDDEPRVEIVTNPIPATPARAAIPKTGKRPAVLARGTLIPAVLETVIDGGKPGGVRAVVTADVRSYDGQQVLIPRSSRLIGQYRAQGGRAYVIWSRVERAGAGAVALGPAPAGTDARFMQSFGAARLQSVVDSAGDTDVRVRPGEPVRVYAAGNIELGKGK